LSASSQVQPNQRRELILKVLEARQKDVGRGRVRIDTDMMTQIDVSPGDVVEIEGQRKTAAIAWPLLLKI